MTLEQARRLLDAAIAGNRPITRAEAEACRCVAERLRDEGFPQGAQSVADRLAAVRQEAQR